jgi:AcrR family transcriptional regulator
MSEKRSFIEEARRTQIVAAAIETLAEIGYVGASLAQIAARAGISTSLIPYHFKDKEALMTQTLNDVAEAWSRYVEERLEAGTTSGQRLRIYLESSLAYIGTRPKHFMAMMEIVFHVRNANGTLLYLADAEDPRIQRLENLLTEGQAQGEFRPFDVHHIAIAIIGTIDQFMGQMGSPRTDLEVYTAEVVRLFDLATRLAEDGT